MRTFNWHRVSDEDDLLREPVPPIEPEPLPLEYDVRDDGELILATRRVPQELAAGCLQEFENVPRSAVFRGRGIRSASNTFGMSAPSNVLQRVVPTRTVWFRDHPHAALERFATWAWQQLPVHQEQRFHDDYRIGESGWTSGIGNDTVPLHYHRDGNNVKESWSGMLCTRAGTSGGDLHLPEYGKAVPVRDCSLIMFPGVKLVHGVTPIKKTLTGGFRYTFVFYPVRAFQGLGSLNDEITKQQARRTELEDTLLDRHKAIGYRE
jgi:hypothetical protein